MYDFIKRTSTRALKKKNNVQKVPLRNKEQQSDEETNSDLHHMVINYNVLILLLVSPLSKFTLHKTQTYCSMRGKWC